MLWTQPELKIDMQLHSAGLVEELVENQNLQPKSSQPEGTGVSVEDQRRIKQREYHRRWRESHRDKWNEYSKQDWINHHSKRIAHRNTPESKQKHKSYCRQYHVIHREELRDYNKLWHDSHKDHIKEYRKRYGPRRRELYQLNRDKILESANKRNKSLKYRLRVQAYCARKRRTDIQYALKDRLRASINRALRRNWVKKSLRTMELVGCTVEELKAHIERQFVNGMIWDNRRTWHIDHFVPIVAFDLTDLEEQKWAFNWQNLRPLTGPENHHKSDKIPDPLPDWLPDSIREKIKSRR